MLWTAPAAVASGVLADNVGTGGTGYVTRDDIAAVAAALLAEGGYEWERLDVTGPAALTPAELATALTEVTGVAVSYRELSDDEFVAATVSQGLPEPMARTIAAANLAIRHGWLEAVSDVVARVAGRQPTSVADFLAGNRTALLGA